MLRGFKPGATMQQKNQFMSITKVVIHFVWSVKNRENLLNPKISEQIFRHMKEAAAQKGIILDTVGGYLNHVHCIVLLKAEQSPSIIAKYIKGESSWWINKNGISESHFRWQSDYYAVSVNPGAINTLRNYIYNQEQHHSALSFMDEVMLLK